MIWTLVRTGSSYLPLIEFSYNNSYQASIKMAPFKALYRRRYRSFIRWFGKAKLLGPDLVLDPIKKVGLIKK